MRRVNVMSKKSKCDELREDLLLSSTETSFNVWIMCSISPDSARRSKTCRYDGARRENESDSCWDSPDGWLDRLRLANSIVRVFRFVVSFLKTNKGSVLPILNERCEMQRRRVLNPDRVIITAAFMSFQSIILSTFLQIVIKEGHLKQQQAVAEQCTVYSRGIDEVITKRSIRITVSHIITICQNNGNDSTSVKYDSRKWRKLWPRQEGFSLFLFCVSVVEHLNLIFSRIQDPRIF